MVRGDKLIASNCSLVHQKERPGRGRSTAVLCGVHSS